MTPGRPSICDTAIAAEAAAAVSRRADAFPRAIAAGKITPADAETELRIWRAMAEEWDWVIRRHTPEPDCAHYATGHERRMALRAALARAETLMLREFGRLPANVVAACVDGAWLHEIETRYGATVEAYLSAHGVRDRIEAMLWWEQRGGVIHARRLLQSGDAVPSSDRAAA